MYFLLLSLVIINKSFNCDICISLEWIFIEGSISRIRAHNINKGYLINVIVKLLIKQLIPILPLILNSLLLSRACFPTLCKLCRVFLSISVVPVHFKIYVCIWPCHGWWLGGIILMRRLRSFSLIERSLGCLTCHTAWLVVVVICFVLIDKILYGAIRLT